MIAVATELGPSLPDAVHQTHGQLAPAPHRWLLRYRGQTYRRTTIRLSWQVGQTPLPGSLATVRIDSRHNGFSAQSTDDESMFRTLTYSHRVRYGPESSDGGSPPRETSTISGIVANAPPLRAPASIRVLALVSRDSSARLRIEQRVAIATNVEPDRRITLECLLRADRRHHVLAVVHHSLAAGNA
jgi:hypothetical protein